MSSQACAEGSVRVCGNTGKNNRDFKEKPLTNTVLTPRRCGKIKILPKMI